MLFYFSFISYTYGYRTNSPLINFSGNCEIHKEYINESDRWYTTSLSLIQNYFALCRTSTSICNIADICYLSIDLQKSTEENDYFWIFSLTRHNKRYYKVNYPAKKKADKKSSFPIKKNLDTRYVFNFFTAFSNIANSNLQSHPPPSIT